VFDTLHSWAHACVSHAMRALIYWHYWFPLSADNQRRAIATSIQWLSKHHIDRALLAVKKAGLLARISRVYRSHLRLLLVGRAITTRLETLHRTSVFRNPSNRVQDYRVIHRQINQLRVSLMAVQSNYHPTDFSIVVSYTEALFRHILTSLTSDIKRLKITYTDHVFLKQFIRDCIVYSDQLFEYS